MTISRMLRVSAALFAVIVICEPARAIRFDWTSEEIQCARSLGIELDGFPAPGSDDYVKRLAWLADLIVIADVTEIRLDTRGAHHTQVGLNVQSVSKGAPPTGQLTVALMSGPVYVPALDEVLEAESVNEPTFEKGERVLLFLTKGHMETPSISGPSYDFPENFYSVVNDAKFKISGGVATLSGWGSGEYDVLTCNLQIDAVVQAQAANCVGGL